MATPPGNGLFIIERILRDRDGIWRQINEERDLKLLILQMLASSALSLAMYGIVLGASNSALQAISSMVKLPLLFLATLAICLPTLYLFNLVFGARLQMAQALALIMVAITVISVLTVAFAPISLFFLVTAHNYQFFKLLNVAVLVLTALVGLRFLTAGMASLNAYQTEREALAGPAAPPVTPVVLPAPAPDAVDGNGAVPAVERTPAAVATLVAAPPLPGPAVRGTPAPVRSPQSTSMTLLYIWILLFGFVGTQLAWTLRPFFGDPGRPFALFRHIDGTFYADILHTISRLLHG